MIWLTLLACGPEPAVVATGVGSANPAVRMDMVMLAKHVEDPAVVAALVVTLSDPSAEIRAGALEALAEQGDASVVPQVLPLLQDPDAKVQRAAVDCLGRLGDPTAAPDLVAYVEAREGSRVPLNAVWALGALGDASALPVLSRLRESSDPYVAYNATRALREIGEPGTAE
jgi:HEAT repeat protein